MRSAGLRTLDSRHGEYVRIAAAGETVLVTNRGRVVAELYVRTKDFVGRKVAKLIETEEQSFYSHASSIVKESSDA